MTKYTITVDDELWSRLKAKVDKNHTINQTIAELIRRFVEEKEK